MAFARVREKPVGTPLPAPIQRRDGKAEIVKGLQDGDVVITAGQFKVREGVAVQMAVTQRDVPGAVAPPKAAAASPAVPKS